MESSWALLQKKVLNQRTWGSREQLDHEIVHWIEHTHNHRRRQRRLGTLTPVEYEIAFHQNNPLRQPERHNHCQPNLQQSRNLGLRYRAHRV